MLQVAIERLRLLREPLLIPPVAQIVDRSYDRTESISHESLAQKAPNPFRSCIYGAVINKNNFAYLGSG